MPEAPERTALYRLYNKDDVLLYVGISLDPARRWKKHKANRSRSHWTGLVTRETVEWFETWAKAEAAEEQAIKTERPIHNGTHNHPLAPFDAANWPAIPGRRGKVAALVTLILKEIDEGRWTPGMMIPKSRDLGAATGMSKNAATNAIRELRRRGRLEVVQGVGVFVYDGTPTRRPNFSPMASSRLLLSASGRPAPPRTREVQ